MPAPIKESEKKKILSQISLLFTKNGFEYISMDEVSRQTKISKATLYKYFTSKEEIIRLIMKKPIHDLSGIQLNAGSSIEEILQHTSAGFSRAVLATTFASSAFLKDLTFRFPDIYAEYKNEVLGFYNRFIEFYENAYVLGYFRKTNIHLIMEQIKGTLPIILSFNYMIDQQTTVGIIIRDYYKVTLCQLLSTKYIHIIDEASTYSFTDELTHLIKIRF